MRKGQEERAALTKTLETRSREYARERVERKRLEERVAVLTSAAGGPVGAAAVVAVVDAEFSTRFAALEREREALAEERASVERYKALLAKQRDIMVLLTSRLTERDESIAALQDRVDAAEAGGGAAADNTAALREEVARLTAEKDSLEVLLQGKLEGMVSAGLASKLGTRESSLSVEDVPQTPTEAAYAASAAASAATAAASAAAHAAAAASSDLALSSLRTELARRSDEVASLQAQLQAELARKSEESEALAGRLSVHEKERRALTIILEQKMKTLVEGIAGGAVAAVTGGEGGGSEGRTRLLRDVQALQRLLNASVTAMKSSEVAPPRSPSASASPGSPGVGRGGSGSGGHARSSSGGSPLPPPVDPPRMLSVDAMIANRKAVILAAEGRR